MKKKKIIIQKQKGINKYNFIFTYNVKKDTYKYISKLE